MSQTVHMDAQDITLQLVGPGTRWENAAGDVEAVPEGKVGLVIQSQFDSVMVTGTPQQLREQVYTGFALPLPDDVPLVDFPDTIAELG